MQIAIDNRFSKYLIEKHLIFYFKRKNTKLSFFVKTQLYCVN